MDRMSDEEFTRIYCEGAEAGLAMAELCPTLNRAESSIRRRAKALGLPPWPRTLYKGMSNAREWTSEISVPKNLPPDHRPIEEIRAQRIATFNSKRNYHEARELINIPIKLKGAIGVWLCGDPHVDDDGCDYPQLMDDKKTVVNTEGMYGINLGDTTNNWVGRLGRLFANQEVSHATATLLAKDFIEDVPWLALVIGNHDWWSGNGLNNPINWMADKCGVVAQEWRVRMNLQFPNGREVRIHSAHDWKGFSMWNQAHGPGRVSKMQYKDHVICCGHIHDFGYMIQTHVDSLDDCCMTHAIRLPGYKVYDDHSLRSGHPPKVHAPYSAVAIINPDAANERGLVTMVFDVQEAGEYLTWLRSRLPSKRRK